MARKRSKAMRARIPSMSDDLTLVKGIGPATVVRLRQAGILTFAQLADLTPEEISAQVTGISAKRIAREKWVKQAQKLALKIESVAPSKSVTHREPSQHYATFMIELLLDAENSVRRTHVTNIQTKKEESWAGWAEPQLLRFISKHAGFRKHLSTHIPLHKTTSDSEVASSLAQPLKVPPTNRLACARPNSILSGTLQILELLTTPLGSNMPRQIVHTDEVFLIHILLGLTKVIISPSILINCSVTIWAKQLGTGTRQIVGEQEITCMPAEKIPCVIEFKIPSQGTYRLEAMAALTPVSTSPSIRSTLRAWHEGGILQVY